MEELKEQCHGGRDVKLQDLFTKADEDRIVPRTTYVFTIGFSWPWCRGLTVTGHLITPFAGKGADQTIRGAMLLGQPVVGALRNCLNKDKMLRNW